MFHLIEATRFHLNGELTEHDLWLKQKFERVYFHWVAKLGMANRLEVISENIENVENYIRI